MDEAKARVPLRNSAIMCSSSGEGEVDEQPSRREWINYDEEFRDVSPVETGVSNTPVPSDSEVEEYNIAETEGTDGYRQEAVGREQNEAVSVVRYCICQQPEDAEDDRFMIRCDECFDWCHGECVNVTPTGAKNIRKFFCPRCQERDPSLVIQYKPHKPKKQDPFASSSGRKRSSRMCGECEACLCQEDCGKCRYCVDMRKFGGPNRLRQKCLHRQCKKMSRLLNGPGVYDGAKPDTAKVDSVKVPTNHHKKKPALNLHHTSISHHRHRRRSSNLPSSPSLVESEELRDARQCWGPACVNAARSHSKYCSSTCGKELAKRRLKSHLPDRFALWSQEESVVCKNRKTVLEDLKLQEKKIRDNLSSLTERSDQLEKLIDDVHRISSEPDQEVVERDQDVDTDIQIDCVCCGHAINLRRALPHIQKCYLRIESLISYVSVVQTKAEGVNIFCDYFSQGQYCKRLRVLCPDHYKEPKIPAESICGCPLTDSFSERAAVCKLPKRTCVGHYGWEKLRQAELDLERLNWLLKLEELQEQLHIVSEQQRTHGHLLAMLLHQTKTFPT